MMLIRGFLLGLGAAAPIGPVNVEIARRTLASGFAAGFYTGLGAVTVDVLYATLASVGLRWLLEQRIFYWALTIAGIALLAYLGLRSLASGIRGLRRGAKKEFDLQGEALVKPTSNPNAYITGLLMTLLNPMTIAFWFVAVPASVGPIASQPRRDLPIICVGVFLGTLSWVIAFAGLLSLAGRFKRWWLPTAADLVGAVLLLGFAALALWNSVYPLL